MKNGDVKFDKNHLIFNYIKIFDMKWYEIIKY